MNQHKRSDLKINNLPLPFHAREISNSKALKCAVRWNSWRNQTTDRHIYIWMFNIVFLVTCGLCNGSNEHSRCCNDDTASRCHKRHDLSLTSCLAWQHTLEVTLQTYPISLHQSPVKQENVVSTVNLVSLLINIKCTNICCCTFHYAQILCCII